MNVAANMVTFVASGLRVAPWRFDGGTATAPPPTKPPAPCSLGGYCIKASCDMRDVDGNKIGEVTGFDTRGSIAERVENVCPYKKSAIRGQTCSEAEVTMLPSRRDLQCDGQIYYELADGVRKRV